MASHGRCFGAVARFVFQRIIIFAPSHEVEEREYRSAREKGEHDENHGHDHFQLLHLWQLWSHTIVLQPHFVKILGCFVPQGCAFLEIACPDLVGLVLLVWIFTTMGLPDAPQPMSHHHNGFNPTCQWAFLAILAILN